jgi:N6-L-threonylcarbamoyladenine synthase
VYFPDTQYCTDNGAMIALVGALRLGEATTGYGFSVKPRWELRTLGPAG